jgi:hypothetical protein
VYYIAVGLEGEELVFPKRLQTIPPKHGVITQDLETVCGGTMSRYTKPDQSVFEVKLLSGITK